MSRGAETPRARPGGLPGRGAGGFAVCAEPLRVEVGAEARGGSSPGAKSGSGMIVPVASGERRYFCR